MIKKLSEYDDYRDFFSDHFNLRKSKSKVFSYQYCAIKLDVSRSYLKLVFNKDRHISLDKLSALSDFFKISLFERQWVTHLFLLNTCSNVEMRQYFKTVVDSFLSSQSRDRENVDQFLDTKSQNSIFTNWLMMVIYNMIGTVDFKWDSDWIFNKVIKLENIQLSDVELTMKGLISLKLVEVLADGAVEKKRSTDPSHVNPWDVEEFSRFKLGHVKSIQAVELLLRGKMPSPGRFQMAAFHVNEDDILAICKLYDDLEVKIRDIALASKQPTRVLMSSNSLFSLTQK